MKQLAFLLFLFAAGTLSDGLNRRWFTVNQKKIEQDEDAAKPKMHELEQLVQEKASDLNPVKDQK
jgi:hypothetical protein